jgi:uncharacterized membrane protein YjgN (DUF898 family)
VQFISYSWIALQKRLVTAAFNSKGDAMEASNNSKALPFKFHGSGGEFFKIWISNIFLSILTLGIYSAWAKVRTNRYFYGNTRLGETGFDYLADPKSILKGRLLAFAIFAAYIASTTVVPFLELPFLLALMIALPWLIVKSMKFRMRNTAFRNIRFGFDGGYGSAAQHYLLLPILVGITLGLAYPYVLNQQKRFMVSNTRFGTSEFSYSSATGKFYKLFLFVLIPVAGLIFLMMLMSSVQAGAPSSSISSIFTLVLVFVYFWIFAFVSAGVSNITYNSSNLADNKFKSSLKAKDLFVIYFTNTLGVIFTLGLFVPWARVRLARYRAEKLHLLSDGNLDNFVAGESEKTGSAGEEMGEMFDIEIGI